MLIRARYAADFENHGVPTGVDVAGVLAAAEDVAGVLAAAEDVAKQMITRLPAVGRAEPGSESTTRSCCTVGVHADRARRPCTPTVHADRARRPCTPTVLPTGTAPRRIRPARVGEAGYLAGQEDTILHVAIDLARHRTAAPQDDPMPARGSRRVCLEGRQAGIFIGSVCSQCGTLLALSGHCRHAGAMVRRGPFAVADLSSSPSRQRRRISDP